MKYSGLKSILANASNLLGGRAVTHIARGVYIVFLARYLGPEFYGLFTYGHHWYLMFLPFAGAGAIGNLLGREVARRKDKLGDYVSSTLSLQVLLVGSASLICALSGWQANEDETIRSLLLILSFALAGRAVTIWAEGVFIAFEQARFSLQQHMVFRPLEVVLGIGILIGGGGLLSVVLLHAAIWIAQAVWSLFVVKERLATLRWLAPFKHFIGFRDLSWLYWLVLLTTMMQQAPVVLFRHTIDNDLLLGQFALVMQLYLLMSAVPDAVVRAALPILSRSVQRRDGKDTIFIQGMIHIGVVVGGIASVTGFLIGPWIVPVLFGQEFKETGKLLGPTLLLLVPFAIYSAGMNVLIAKGKFHQAVLASFLGALVLVIGVPWMALRGGMIGAIMGAGLGLTVASITMLVIQIRYYQLRVDGHMLRTAGLALGAAVCYIILHPASNTAAALVAYCILFVASIGVYKRFKSALN